MLQLLHVYSKPPPPNMQGPHAHLYLLLSEVSVPRETAPTHGVQWSLPPTSGQNKLEPTPVRIDLYSSSLHTVNLVTMSIIAKWHAWCFSK